MRTARRCILVVGRRVGANCVEGGERGKRSCRVKIGLNMPAVRKRGPNAVWPLHGEGTWRKEQGV